MIEEWWSWVQGNECSQMPLKSNKQTNLFINRLILEKRNFRVSIDRAETKMNAINESAALDEQRFHSIETALVIERIEEKIN
ncbi:hypothetical protein OnM2_058043 [Erysiphe neolycopersici]|uniref:Uncharacterized protein n=1 Tax=Erysiphe neolycopersici TaxID=212602 RepID=A0A420HQB1_9PEZI|nr:hypothetical protein OnM2_058043 [Erysiphe neolycopersici]